MPTSILTTDDLEQFKGELLQEISELFEQHAPAPKRNWMRSTEVMAHLKISHGTLQNLRNNKTIPSYKVEGLIYYDREEIDTLISQNRLSHILAE